MKLRHLGFLGLFTLGQLSAQDTSSATLLLELKARPSAQELQALTRILKSRPKLFDNYPSDYFQRLYKAQIPGLDDDQREELTRQLEATGLVNRLEKSEALEAQSIVVTDYQNRPLNDPFISYQWGAFLNQQKLRLDIDDITTQLFGANTRYDTHIFPAPVDSSRLQEVLVAVLDSGIDLEHEDLAANIYVNSVECDSAGQIPFRAQTDNDGNGLKGDCKGWNFTSAQEGDNRPYDDLGHGTHVAGIIAAVQNNGLGIAGVAANAKILPIKIMKKQENLQNGREAISFTDRVAKGLLYAIKMKARVVNLSLGWPASLDKVHLREAFKEALKQGVLIIAASGNNSSERAIFPCSYSGVVCVGASSIDGSLANFSNFGGHVDFQAPGDQILSLFPKKFEPSFFSVRGLEIKNGTSQSAPLVAGMAAVALGLNPELDAARLIGRFHAASGVDEEQKTLSKVPSLKRLLEKSDGEAVVRPVFKDIQTVAVSETGEFSIRIPVALHALSSEQELSAEVSFEDSQGAVSLNSTLQLDRTSSTAWITILGRFERFDVESEQAAKIEITAGSSKATFRNLFVFARNLPKAGVAEIALRDLPPPLSQQLKTVNFPFRHRSAPSYYLELPLTPEGGKVLKTFHLENDAFKIAQSELTQADRLLGVYRLDLNYDGREDYLVRAIGKIGEKQVILYYYLDNELKPLFFSGPFVYHPDQAVWDPRSSVFIKSMIGGKAIATMAFKARGGVPAKDRLNDPFNPAPDQGTDDHLYYFMPDFVKKEFTIRLLDTHAWREELRTRESAQWWEPITLLEVFSQNEARFQASRGNVLLSLGTPPQERYFSLEIGSDFRAQVRPFETGRNTLIGSIKVPLVNLDQAVMGQVDFEASNLFVGMISDQKGQLSMLDPQGEMKITEEVVLDYRQQGDSVLGAQAAFFKNSRLYAFFQTKGHLLVSISGGDAESKLYKTPLHRVSFLPGSVFNELYYPVVAEGQSPSGEQSEVMPGFYIDSTQLYARHLYLILVGEQGPSRPLQSSYLIPENCRPLNPVSYLGKESFAFLCLAGAKVTLKYLPFL
jgi:cell wall-associated protease